MLLCVHNDEVHADLEVTVLIATFSVTGVNVTVDGRPYARGHFTCSVTLDDVRRHRGQPGAHRARVLTPLHWGETTDPAHEALFIRHAASQLAGINVLQEFPKTALFPPNGMCLWCRCFPHVDCPGVVAAVPDEQWPLVQQVMDAARYSSCEAARALNALTPGAREVLTVLLDDGTDWHTAWTSAPLLG